MKRRVVDVPAVHWIGTNESEVDDFVSPHGYRFRGNPHGGWSHLRPRRHDGPRRTCDVWIGSWLLIVPENPTDVTVIGASLMAELYRGVTPANPRDEENTL